MHNISKALIFGSLFLVASLPLTSYANAVGPSAVGQMSRPKYSPAAWEVKNTTTAALNLLFNYDYKNINVQMKKASQYFTADAWKSYQEAFAKSHNMQFVQAKKITVSAIVGQDMNYQMTRTAPFIWTVTIPVQVKYQSIDSTRTQKLLAIARLTQDKSHQYKIMQLVMQAK